MTKGRKKTNVILAIIFVIFLFLHFDGYEVFIFQDGMLPPDYTFNLSQPFSEVNLKAGDGANLHAILLPSKNPPKGIILYFHGNRGNLSRWADECSYLTKYDYHVMVIDYRGYGKSTGKRSEANFYSDAFLAYQHCRKSFPPEQIVVYGRSLGTGPACWLAANAQIQALILETPYTQFAQLVDEKVWGLPMHWFLDYLFDNQMQLKHTLEPVWIVHGTHDELIPLEHAQILSKECTHSGSSILVVENGRHNNLPTFKSYQQGLEKFLLTTEHSLSQ